MDIQKRPNLNDPKEYALIKSIYFPADNFDEEISPLERLDRMQVRKRKINQAR